MVILLRSVLAGLLLLPACAQTSAKHAVRWSPELKLSAIGQIGAEMAKPLEDEIEVGGPGGEKATVKDCNSALDLESKKYGAPRDAEARVLQYQTVRCLALRALKTAAPAKTSHLDGFRLDEKSLALLPPSLGIVVSNDDVARVKQAEQQQQTWKQFAPEAQAKVDPPGEDRKEPSLLVEDKSWRVRLTEYGRGDFNADGVEDLLVRDEGQLTGGSYVSHRIFILTRTGASDPLRVVRELKP